MVSEEIKYFIKTVNDNCEGREGCEGCNFKHGDCIINLSGEVAEILSSSIKMSQIDKIKSMSVEEMAKSRIAYAEGDDETSDRYVGDFGESVIQWGVVDRDNNYIEAYQEALRLEMEWLNSEVKEVVE